MVWFPCPTALLNHSIFNECTLSGASGKSLVELGNPYKETCDGAQVEKVDCGRAVGD